MFLLQYYQMEGTSLINVNFELFYLGLSQRLVRSYLVSTDYRVAAKIQTKTASRTLHREKTWPDFLCLFVSFDLTQLCSAGGIERNFSLTITAADNSDLGDYPCVAINKGGMAERNITLTFTGVNVAYSQVMKVYF